MEWATIEHGSRELTEEHNLLSGIQLVTKCSHSTVQYMQRPVLHNFSFDVPVIQQFTTRL